jgi:hypothetical protein
MSIYRSAKLAFQLGAAVSLKTRCCAAIIPFSNCSFALFESHRKVVFSYSSFRKPNGKVQKQDGMRYKETREAVSISVNIK